MSTPKTLTLFECHQLLDALLVKKGTEKQFRQSIRNYTIALLMLDAGLRVGEVVALQMSDLYYGGVPVENLLIRPEIAKTKTERTVPLSERIRRALVEYYEKHPEILWGVKDTFAFGGYLIGHPMTTRQVERIIRAAAMKSIGRPVHPHVLRHTFASKLMRKTNARIVQELLGHSSITSTQIYTHPNEDDKKKAIADIEDKETSDALEGQVGSELSSVPNHLNTGSTDRDV